MITFYAFYRKKWRLFKLFLLHFYGFDYQPIFFLERILLNMALKAPKI